MDQDGQSVLQQVHHACLAGSASRRRVRCGSLEAVHRQGDFSIEISGRFFEDRG